MKGYLQIYVLLLVAIGSCTEKPANKEPVNSVHTLVKLDTTAQVQNEPYQANEEFKNAVESLETIGFYRKKLDCHNSTDNGYCCLIDPTANWLNKAIESSNEIWGDVEIGYKYIKPINFEGLEKIKKYFIVADYEVQPKTYPRANIYEWTFGSIENCIYAQSQLERLSRNDWYYISKTPITWWRNENKIYFIDPSGFFVLTEVPKIEAALKEKL